MKSEAVEAGSAREGSKGAVVIDTEKIRSHLNEVVRSTVEVTLNQLLDEEADRIAGAGMYERSSARRNSRAGSCRRKLLV